MFKRLFLVFYDGLGEFVERTRLSSGVLPVLCGKDGRWKTKLEELLQPNQVVVLLALGDVKHGVLSYLHAHPNIQILEMSTRHIKKKEKGLGLTPNQIIKELVSINIEAIRALRSF